MSNKEERSCIPPVKDTQKGGYTPFKWRAANLFRNPYWYGVIAGFIGLLYTAEFIAWYKPWLVQNEAEDNRADYFMIGMALYWGVCLIIPNICVWLVLRTRKKSHD